MLLWTQIGGIYPFSRHCKVASTLSQDIVRWNLPLRRMISHLQYSYGISHSMNQLLGAHHFGMSILNLDTVHVPLLSIKLLYLVRIDTKILSDAL